MLCPSSGNFSRRQARQQQYAKLAAKELRRQIEPKLNAALSTSTTLHATLLNYLSKKGVEEITKKNVDEITEANVGTIIGQVLNKSMDGGHVQKACAPTLKKLSEMCAANDTPDERVFLNKIGLNAGPLLALVDDLVREFETSLYEQHATSFNFRTTFTQSYEFRFRYLILGADF
jgi:hypothetical protein